MLNRLLSTTAFVAALSVGALAGNGWAQEGAPQPTVQPPAEMLPAPGAGEDAGTAADNPDNAGLDGIEQAATPPPAGTVKEVQAPTESRTDELIGMTVNGSDGERIGSAEDLLIGDGKQVTGVVIEVGGFLGIGSKSVAVNWDEVELRPDVETGSQEMFVSVTREQLEAAPAFKTTEDLRAEAAAEALQQESPAGPGTLPVAPPSTATEPQ